MDVVWEVAWALIPTIIIGVFFGLILYAIFNADRKAREIATQVEHEERARRGLAPKPARPRSDEAARADEGEPGGDTPGGDRTGTPQPGGGPPR